MDDPVNHPSHYTQYEHEVIELTEQLSFKLGNAVKYILRAPYKGNREQDLEKAKWYVENLKPKHDKVYGVDPDLVKSYNNVLVDALVLGIQHACERAEPKDVKMCYKAVKTAVRVGIELEISKNGQ